MNDQFSEYVRKQFPALKREVNGYPVAYLDGPGGYQVPESVIAAVNTLSCQHERQCGTSV